MSAMMARASCASRRSIRSSSKPGMAMATTVVWLVHLTQQKVRDQETRRSTLALPRRGGGNPLEPRRVFSMEKSMAEFTKGLENLQEASTAVATASAAYAAQARSALESVLASLNEVSDKFFIKTMMSVPPTKACRTEATAVAALAADQKWPSLPAAVEKLEKATKALITKAKMDGTTIT